MPDITRKLHNRRHERVVLGKLDLRWEDSPFIRRAFGSLDQRLPEEEVIFVDGAGGDAIGRVLREVFVLMEEPFAGDRVHGVLRFVQFGSGCWK